jgi:hypothetical protein
MSASTVTSAYPASLAELLPRARALAAELGSLPSRNRLMAEFRIGAAKANALRDTLATDPTPAPAPALPDSTGPVDPAAPTAPAPTVADPAPPAAAPTTGVQVSRVGHPDTNITTATAPTAAAPIAARRGMAIWPLVLLALPAFVAVWSGWVGLGGLTGFGVVHPLPGIADKFALNTAITLPIGVETYAAYALRAWLSGHLTATARRFAKWSAIGSLTLGALGQVAYHVMAAAHLGHAPVWVTTLVACLPVAVLGMGAALAHLVRDTPTT